MTEIIRWVMTENGHELRLYFKKYSLSRILSWAFFRGNISYTIQAKKSIFGNDPSRL
jgi:hypothetical protein